MPKFHVFRSLKNEIKGSQKKLENDKFLRTALHCEFYIWNIQMWILLIFVVLQGEFQEKLNKLESESENEGGSSNFGRFSYFQFC